MSEADLSKLLTDLSATQADFDAWWNSDGAKLLRGKWDQLKTDLGLMELASQVFKLTPEGLVAITKAIDAAFKQADSLAAAGPDRIALIQKLLARPKILWVVASLLN